MSERLQYRLPNPVNSEEHKERRGPMLDSVLRGEVDRDTFEESTSALRVELLNSQFELRDQNLAVLVLLAGNDLIGVDDVLDRLHQWLDARDLQTAVFGVPAGKGQLRQEHGRGTTTPNASNRDRAPKRTQPPTMLAQILVVVMKALSTSLRRGPSHSFLGRGARMSNQAPLHRHIPRSLHVGQAR